jgi:hypothetical protein
VQNRSGGDMVNVATMNPPPARMKTDKRHIPVTAPSRVSHLARILRNVFPCMVEFVTIHSSS